MAFCHGPIKANLFRPLCRESQGIPKLHAPDLSVDHHRPRRLSDASRPIGRSHPIRNRRRRAATRFSITQYPSTFRRSGHCACGRGEGLRTARRGRMARSPARFGQLCPTYPPRRSVGGGVAECTSTTTNSPAHIAPSGNPVDSTLSVGCLEARMARRRQHTASGRLSRFCRHARAQNSRRRASAPRTRSSHHPGVDRDHDGQHPWSRSRPGCAFGCRVDRTCSGTGESGLQVRCCACDAPRMVGTRRFRRRCRPDRRTARLGSPADTSGVRHAVAPVPDRGLHAHRPPTRPGRLGPRQRFDDHRG